LCEAATTIPTTELIMVILVDTGSLRIINMPVVGAIYLVAMILRNLLNTINECAEYFELAPTFEDWVSSQGPRYIFD
jgi:hypothetical protein